MYKAIIKDGINKLFLATNYSHRSRAYFDAKQKKHLSLVDGLIFKEREQEWMQEKGFVKNGILSKKNLAYLLECLKFLEEGNSFEELKKEILTEKPVSKEQIVILKRILYFSKKGPEFFEYFYKSDRHKLPQLSKFVHVEEILERLKTENKIYKVNEQIRLGIYKPPKESQEIEESKKADDTSKVATSTEGNQNKTIKTHTKHHHNIEQ